MIHFEDILGLPYLARGTDPSKGVDCAWAARQGLARIFPDFRPEDFPLDPREEAKAIELARISANAWTRIGGNVFAATTAGDLLLGDHEGGEMYVAVLVDSEKREVLTATHTRGVHLCPIRKLTNVRDVFRRNA